MKKLNQKAFSHIELIIVAVVIALVAGIGYTVWQRSSNSNPDSQAASKISVSFTKVLDSKSYGKVYACKNSSNFHEGAQYFFEGSKAKQLTGYWSSTRPGLGGQKSIPKLTKKGQVKNTGTIQPGSPDKRNKTTWTFKLKNKSNKTKSSGAKSHSKLKTCIKSTTLDPTKYGLVVHNSGLGSVYGCKVSNSNISGIKYFFNGNNIESVKAEWTYTKPNSSEKLTGNDSLLSKSNSLRSFRPNNSMVKGESGVLQWKFVVKSKSRPQGTIITSPKTQSQISTSNCPSSEVPNPPTSNPTGPGNGGSSNITDTITYVCHINVIFDNGDKKEVETCGWYRY